MVRVKLCGIRSARDLAVAVESGADALGFLVGLTHTSEDGLTPDVARDLIRSLPPFVTSVLVTHLTAPDEVAALAQVIGAQTIQLQGDMTPPDVARLGELAPHLKLLKSLHVTPGAMAEHIAELASEYEPLVDALLLDSRTPDRLGGTGQPHDWRISGAIRRLVRKPVILAGGLRPENLRAAIEIVAPYAVDVNSGVEDGNGDKDATRCGAFVRMARDLAPLASQERVGGAV